MSKSKTNYYILVFTNEGPVFLTGFGEHNIAYWDKNEKPKAMTKEYANEVSTGLIWNGFANVVVLENACTHGQVYNYDKGKFEWKSL